MIGQEGHVCSIEKNTPWFIKASVFFDHGGDLKSNMKERKKIGMGEKEET